MNERPVPEEMQNFKRKPDSSKESESSFDPQKLMVHEQSLLDQQMDRREALGTLGKFAAAFATTSSLILESGCSLKQAKIEQGETVYNFAEGLPPETILAFDEKRQKAFIATVFSRGLHAVNEMSKRVDDYRLDKKLSSQEEENYKRLELSLHKICLEYGVGRFNSVYDQKIDVTENQGTIFDEVGCNFGSEHLIDKKRLRPNTAEGKKILERLIEKASQITKKEKNELKQIKEIYNFLALTIKNANLNSESRKKESFPDKNISDGLLFTGDSSNVDNYTRNVIFNLILKKAGLDTDFLEFRTKENSDVYFSRVFTSEGYLDFSFDEGFPLAREFVFSDEKRNFFGLPIDHQELARIPSKFHKYAKKSLEKNRKDPFNLQIPIDDAEAVDFYLSYSGMKKTPELLEKIKKYTQAKKHPLYDRFKKITYGHESVLPDMDNPNEKILFKRKLK